MKNNYNGPFEKEKVLLSPEGDDKPEEKPKENPDVVPDTGGEIIRPGGDEEDEY